MNAWEIENFSCWTYAIHGELITLSGSLCLYPGGRERMNEGITLSSYDDCVNELFFIASDGSTICTRRPDDCIYSSRMKTITGPKFEAVVALIRDNEPRYKDRLILRWKTSGGNDPKRFRTVLDASTAFFEVKPEMLVSNYKKIAKFTFASMDEKERNLCISARKYGSKINDTKVTFDVESCELGKIFVRASIWILSNNNIIRRHESDNVFMHKGNKTLPFKVLLQDVQDLKAVMRCKILTGRVYEDGDAAFLPLSYFLKISNSSIIPEVKSLENQSTLVSDATGVSQPENTVTVLAKDLMCLYRDNHLSDMELRCGTASFPTHKNILSARSPVFKAMLSGDMREAACGHVDVEDLDPHTLGRFISFLYSGSTGEEALQWEEAAKLYYAADKYHVPSLKEECAAVLRKRVAIQNVCDILSLEDRHQDEKLRSVAYEFIAKNYNKVLESQNWEKFMMTDPLLVAKTLTNIAKNKCVSINDSK